MSGSFSPEFLTDLRHSLVESFSLSELQTLCSDLGVDYDELGSAGKEAQVRELILYLDRRGRLPELVAHCAAQRPNLEWERLKNAATKKPVLWEVPEPVTPIQAAAPLQARPPIRKAIAPRVVAVGLLILLIIGAFGVVKALQSLAQPKQAATGLPSVTAQLATQLETPQAQPAAYAVSASISSEPVKVGEVRYQILETIAEPYTAEHFLLKLHVRLYNDSRIGVGLWADSFRIMEDGIPREPDSQNDYTHCNIGIDKQAASDSCYLAFSLSNQASDLQLKIIGGNSEAEMTLPVAFKVGAPSSIPTTTPSALPGGPFTVSASTSSEAVKVGEVRYQVLSLQAEPYSSDKVLLTLQMRGINDGPVEVIFWEDNFRILEDGVPRQPDTSLNQSCNLSLLAQSSSDACQLKFIVSAQAKEVKLRIFNDQGAESFLPVTFAVTRP